MPDERDPISDAGARWGAAGTMSDMEALMWRCETSPRLRSGGVLLEMLDRLPAWVTTVALNLARSQMRRWRSERRARDRLGPLHDDVGHDVEGAE